MTDEIARRFSVHHQVALEAVELDGADVAELTARVIHLFDKLTALDPVAAGELLTRLPDGWHGPKRVQ